MIKNKKLKNILTKGTNYRGTQTISFSKLLIEYLLLLIHVTKLWHLKPSIPPQTLSHGKRKY